MHEPWLTRRRSRRAEMLTCEGVSRSTVSCFHYRSSPASIVIPICTCVERTRRALSAAVPLVPPQAHPGRGAAVYVEDLPCDEVRSVGDEECYREGDVVRVAHAAPGDQGVAELGGVVRDVEVAGDLYDAWADGVDPNLAIRELYGELAGEGVDRAFGSRVGRVVGEAREPVDRGYVDDAPASTLHHEGHGPAGEEEVALHVEVEDRVVGRLVGIQEVQRPGDAGVVHERIEPAEGLCCGVHGPLAVAHLAQVALYGGGLTAELLY